MKTRTIFKVLLIIVLALYAVTVLSFILGGETIPEALFVASMNMIGAQFTPFHNFATVNNSSILGGELTGVIGEIGITIMLTTWFYEFLRHIDIGVKMASRRVGSLSGHIIISPINPFSMEIAQRLKSQKLDFVLADKHRHKVVEALNQNLLAVEADISNRDGTSRAMLDRAKWLVLLNENDIDNVVSSMAAKSENKRVSIVSRCRRPDDIDRIRTAGAADVVLPERAVGEEISEFLLKNLK